jgi:hypothetical protein
MRKWLRRHRNGSWNAYGRGVKKRGGTSNINVVICGHCSTDSLGMNLFLDELEKRGIEIVSCSGLIRISRNK